MKKPVIAVDVDDVLADNAAGFVAFSNQRWGTNLHTNDYDEHWAKIWNIEHDYEETTRRRDEFIASRIHKNYSPVDGAQAVLLRLKEDFDLRVVTSRLNIMKTDTIDWLNNHYEGIFNEDTVHFAGVWETVTADSFSMTKSDTIKSIGADYLIDDQLKHCEGAAKDGVAALLFGDYTWNKTDTLMSGVSRVNSWVAVEEYFYHGS